MGQQFARRTTIYALLILSSVVLPAQIRTESFRGRPVAAGEVLVRFKTATRDEIAQAQQAVDADLARPVGGVPRLFRFHSRSQNVAALLSHFRARPNVLYAEPNFIVHATQTPNDTKFPQLWGLQNTGQTVLFSPGTPGADIGAVAAWDITTGSTANAIAVVDTGVDYTHPDLAANVWSAPSGFTVTIGGANITCAAGTHGFNALTDTCDPMDDNSHGTHVSGTIGAVGNNSQGVVGVNWTARIMGAKFLDASGSGTDAGAADAIEFAIQAKLAFGGGANVRVLNASFGGPDFSQALLDEINRAGSNGVLLVAAAGNNGTDNDTSPEYPASYAASNIVAVAATDSNDDIAYFSNYGVKTVHLGAPGVNILSTVPGNSYQYLSGTSMATPHVTGAAAMVLAACSLDTAGLKAALLNNVDLLPSLAGLTTTGGRLNVSHALHGCTDLVSVSPSSLSFGNQATGTSSAAQTLTLTNNQLTALTISNIGATGDFAQTNTCAGSVAAGGHCSISVTFTPSVSGYRTGTVTVTDDAQGSPQTANLAGSGVAPVTVTPTALAFAATVVGTSSAAQTVMLANNQSTALAISSITASSDFAQSNNCGTSLAPQGSCNVNVTFTPTAAGTRTGTISVVDNASNSPQTVSLSGSALAQVSLSNTALYFGSTVVGSTSVAQTLTLTNNQNAALSISSIATAGDFLVQSNTCGNSLAAQGTCTISISFAPTATGTRTGTITVTDSAGSQAANLTGVGLVQASLWPRGLTFLGTAVGSTSTASNATLTNNQNAKVLSIGSILASGDFAQTNTCGTSLAPLATCNIAVTFTPTALGARSGTLTVTDNATNTPQTLALNGGGIAQTTLSASALFFGNTGIGSSSSAQNLTLTNNQNTKSVSISTIAVTGDFSQTNTCGSSLAPLAKCTIAVTFTPTALGTRTGSLTITDSASNSPQVATLSGSGVAQVTLSPAALTFSSTAVGGTSTAQTVTLTNNQSTAGVSISSIAATGDFAQTNTCGTSLAALAKCTITVTFSPTAIGTRSGNLTVTDNAGNSPQGATLSGSGIAQATLSPTVLSFAATAVGSSSTVQNATLSNNQSAATLTISGIAASGDFFQTNTCGISLPALGKCSISVTFKPTATGTRSGTITVTDTASSSPQLLSLTGSGVAPVTLSTTALFFGSTAIASTSGAQTLTLTNNQNATAVSISGIVASGDFAQTNTCGSSVPALGKCSISITFTPSATGTRTGTITVTDSAGNSPQSASLTGTGVAQATLWPPGLSFSGTVGTTSAAKTVTLTNNQNATALAITSIVTSGDFAQTNNCGTSLAPLATCNIGVTFTPTATGARSGALTVTDSATNSPQVVSLSGTAQ